MRKLLPFLALTFSLTALSAQDVFQKIEDASRYQLADAYWLVADRFEALGQKARADEFRKEAKALFPGYPQKPQDTPAAAVPGSTVENAQTAGTIDPLTGIASRPAVRERNLNGQRIVRFQFSKLLRGFVTGDANLTLSVLANGLKVNEGPVQGLADVLVPAKEYFGSLDTSTLTPSGLFRMETLDIQPISGTVDDWTLKIEAKTEENPQLAALPFWKKNQTYIFTREGDLWKLKEIQSAD